MNKDISKALDSVYRASKSLRREEYELLFDALMELSRILNADNRNPDAKRRALSQIATSVRKRADFQDPRYLAKSGFSIRQIRNMLAHRRSVSPRELRAAFPVFWQILSKTAKEWEPSSLNNLLAYSLKSPPHMMDGRVSNARLINYYKAYFNTLPEDIKEFAFKDLLLRVYSEDPFRRFVEQSPDNER